MTNEAAKQLARVEPESRAALEQLLTIFPQGIQALPILQRREALTAMIVQMSATVPQPENVVVENRTITSADGTYQIPIRIYRPTVTTDACPGIYYTHGGGMVVGDLESGDFECKAMCSALGAVVVNVDYRLAPENPYPIPVEDCYTGLVWMTDHAADLGVNIDRIAIYGPSAGGGLAVATTLLAIDRNGPKLCFVMAIYPMLDDRNVTPSSHQITALGAWDRFASLEAWDAYLGGQDADHYAAPIRREDVTGFPPTFIDVGSEDAFRDEDIAFASKLLAAGVQTELHVYPGAFHGSEMMAPTSPLNQRILARRMSALAEKLN